MTIPDDMLQSYVRAALTLQGYAFDEPRVADIAAQFARFAAIAATLPADPAAPGTTDPGAAAIFRP